MILKQKVVSYGGVMGVPLKYPYISVIALSISNKFGLKQILLWQSSQYFQYVNEIGKYSRQFAMDNEPISTYLYI